MGACVEISNEISSKYEQTRIVSSADNDENHKEEKKGEEKKSKIIGHDVSNDVIFYIGLSKTIEDKEQSNQYKVKENMYE